MIKKIEMALLQPSKETERKLRWSTYIEKDAEYFKIYIPKWRVPKPWPGRVYVGIEAYKDVSSDLYPSTSSPKNLDEENVIIVARPSIRSLITSNPKNLDKSIQAIVKPFENHTRTMRYRPIGDQNEWQIGEPYIPYSLIPPGSDLLFIEVEWDLNSKGKFVNVPTYRDDI